jgi:transcriptional regulator with XRE-family HTH domain
MAIRAVFSENLKRIRQQQGLSQERLALKAGMARAYIGLLERKKSSPTIDVVERLAKTLKVKPDELLRG